MDKHDQKLLFGTARQGIFAISAASGISYVVAAAHPYAAVFLLSAVALLSVVFCWDSVRVISNHYNTKDKS